MEFNKLLKEIESELKSTIEMNSYDRKFATSVEYHLIKLSTTSYYVLEVIFIEIQNEDIYGYAISIEVENDNEGFKRYEVTLMNSIGAIKQEVYCVCENDFDFSLDDLQSKINDFGFVLLLLIKLYLLTGKVE